MNRRSSALERRVVRVLLHAVGWMIRSILRLSIRAIRFTARKAVSGWRAWISGNRDTVVWAYVHSTHDGQRLVRHVGDPRFVPHGCESIVVRIERPKQKLIPDRHFTIPVDGEPRFPLDFWDRHPLFLSFIILIRKLWIF